MTRYLSPHGELDEPDLTERLSPWGRLPPDPGERAAAEMAWNAPGFGVIRGGEAVAQPPPIPAELRGALGELTAAINRELAAVGFLSISSVILWRVLLDKTGRPSPELRTAIAGMLARSRDSGVDIDEALHRRLAALAAVPAWEQLLATPRDAVREFALHAPPPGDARPGAGQADQRSARAAAAGWDMALAAFIPRASR